MYIASSRKKTNVSSTICSSPWAPKGGQNFEFPWICFQLRNYCMGCHIIANYQTLGMIIWGMVIFWPLSPVLTRGGGKKGATIRIFNQSHNAVKLFSWGLTLSRVFDFQSSFAKKNAMGTHFTHTVVPFRGEFRAQSLPQILKNLAL